MKTGNILKLWILGTVLFTSLAFATSVPPTITFQGRLTDHGSPAVGTHNMNFAIMTNTGTTIWKNDPSEKVAVSVVQGIYTIELGNTAIPHMAPLSLAAFDNAEQLSLRIWVNDEQLTPDIALISTPYSFIAQQAETLTANQVAGESAIVAINTGTNQIDLGRVNNAAAATREINTGAGLMGGGNLTSDRTITIANGGITSTMLTTNIYIDGTITTANYALTANYAYNVDWTDIHNVPALASSLHQHTSTIDGGLLNDTFLYVATVTTANNAATASFAYTASTANYASVANYAYTANNANYAATANYANTSSTSNYSSFSNIANFATTANYANNVNWINISNVPPLASSIHTHDASSINSGVLDDARLSTTVTKLGPTIESTEITDGTIVNADISNTAAIAWTKINKTGALAGDIGAEPAVSAGTAAQYYRGDKTWQTFNPAAIGAEPAFTTLPVSKGGTGVTTITGIVKGNGVGAFTAAIAGTDYQTPITNPVTGTGTTGQVAYWNGTGTQTGTTSFTFNGTTLAVGSVAVTTVSANGNLDFIY